DPAAYRKLCDDVGAEVTFNEKRLAALLELLEHITGDGAKNGVVATAAAANGTPAAAVGLEPAAAMTTAVPATHVREHRLWSRLPAARGPAEPPLQFERLQEELSDRDFWHRAAPVPFLQGVCDVHAAMWQRLHEWLEEPRDHCKHADTDFSCAIAQAA